MLDKAIEYLEDRFFVGRQGERRLFSMCLEQQSLWPIINVHGPAGVGKTAMLRIFRRMAERRGVSYSQVDVSELPNQFDAAALRLAFFLTPPGMPAGTLQDALEHLHLEAAHRRIVVALDTYEAAGPLEHWLRESFLARLPDTAIIVIASRPPLKDIWRDLPAWRRLVHPLPLSTFDLHETRSYLNLHQIEDESLIRLAWCSTQGLPLALSLAVALVKQDGPGILKGVGEHPAVVSELARRWLREVADDRLRELLEAAITVRRFDEDILLHITGTPLTPSEFDQLTSLSFIRLGRTGWTIHSLVRSALLRELRWRSPGRLAAMRQRALWYYAHLLTSPARNRDWGATLEEFFYLLGDALIGATIFHESDEDEDLGLEVVPAGQADLPSLLSYFEACRRRAETEGPVPFEIVDRNTGARFTYPYLWVDFVRAPLDFPALLQLGDGVVRLAKDPRGRLRGVSVIIPVNSRTLPWLETQPVTRAYFRTLSPEEKAELDVPENETATWFIRHLHSCQLEDASARSALFRDLFRLAFRNGCLLTSSPAPFFQDLLKRCGFEEIPGSIHTDFGDDRPCPVYCLDTRGHRLAKLLERMMQGGTLSQDAAGLTTDIKPGPLTTILADRLTGWAWAATPSGERVFAKPANTLLGSLTRRERDVALAVMEGMSNKEISTRLGITPLTVKKHLTRIFAKTGTTSRAQLIRKLLSQRF